MNHCYNVFAVHSISLFAHARVVIAASALCCLLVFQWTASAVDPSEFFSIKVVDDETGRGVPLVELRTVSNSIYISDSNGVVAFHEPGMMNGEFFFFVRSHGYEFPRDGFGNAGLSLKVAPGTEAEVRIKRLNIAERLYRITGEGIYRDSVLLGLGTPLKKPTLNALVAGQDTTMAAVYKGKIFWFGGDTNRLTYPLGHFWTAGAVSELPGRGGLDPAVGIDLTYFTGDDGFSRGMWPRPAEGLIWTDGVVVVPDEKNQERMVAHYTRLKKLDVVLEHGLGVFNDQTNTFEKVVELNSAEKWRCPNGHPVLFEVDGTNYCYIGAARDSHAPFPAVRVRAQFASITNPASYEAFTPLAPGTHYDGASTRVERAANGALIYGWKPHTAPINPAQERELLRAGVLRAEEARYQPRDTESGDVIQIGAGSVRWNAYRKKWIMIGVQTGGKQSYLGEVWFAEADAVLGPWRWARKIVTHERYSFYNPVHHPFFDQEGGRLIYFEGTYTNTFSGNEEKTPRYDYNQIMYRLDLSDPRLRGEQAP